MEAKDTIIKTEDHSQSIWCPHCGEEFGVESIVKYAREEQAEVSFAAGLFEGQKGVITNIRKTIVEEIRKEI